MKYQGQFHCILYRVSSMAGITRVLFKVQNAYLKMKTKGVNHMLFNFLSENESQTCKMC